jgi:hypothetical protein
MIFYQHSDMLHREFIDLQIVGSLIIDPSRSAIVGQIKTLTIACVFHGNPTSNSVRRLTKLESEHKKTRFQFWKASNIEFVSIVVYLFMQLAFLLSI